MHEFLIYIFLISIFLFSLNKFLSRRFNLFDLPDNNRKFHEVKMPLTGGLIIFVSIIFIIMINEIYFQNYLFLSLVNLKYLFIGSLVFFIVGFLDDKYNLNANLKFFVFAAVIVALIYQDPSLSIKTIKLTFMENNYFIGLFGSIWTLICFLLYLNALNMFDGVNGQVGTYVLGTFIYIYISNSLLSNFALVICIPIIIFIIYNLTNRCFIGNSGTYFLSFLIGYIFIKSYNTEDIFKADQIVLIMLIPGLDLMRLFIYRIINKRNPFKPDRHHLHHYLEKIVHKKYIFLISNLLIWSFVFFAHINGKYLEVIIFKTTIYSLLIYFLSKKQTKA